MREDKIRVASLPSRWLRLQACACKFESGTIEVRNTLSLVWLDNQLSFLFFVFLFFSQNLFFNFAPAVVICSGSPAEERTEFSRMTFRPH